MSNDNTNTNTPPAESSESATDEQTQGDPSYSPSSPYLGSILDYLNASAVQGEELCQDFSSSATSNSVVVDSGAPAISGLSTAAAAFNCVAAAASSSSYALPPSSAVAPSALSPTWNDFTMSPDFFGWYNREVEQGNLDSVILSDDWCLPGPFVTAPQPRAPSPSASLPVSADVQALLDLLQATIDQNSALLSVVPAPPATINPAELQRKCRSYVDDEGPDDAPEAEVVAPNVNIRINNDDLHNFDRHSVSSIEVPLADECDSSDEEEDDVLEVNEVVRYYWNQGDVRFLIVRNGTQSLLSFETLEERFTGVKSAIWAFWQKRKRGRVDPSKVREFMRCHGHSSFHARCMWHLLVEHEERMLITAQRKGILHTVRL
jgi:hypothetical protein